MSKIELKKFIELIIPVLLDAGELAVGSQKKVTNIGKVVKGDELYPERIKQRGRAKTEIDEKIQELILLSIKEKFDVGNFLLDAEEDTPSKKLFNGKANVSLVIDPIDGTLEYVNGRDTYSINLGLVENGKIITTLVYFPIIRALYYINESNTPFVIIYDKNHKQISKEQLIHNPNNTNKIYTNNRVSDEAIICLEKNGYIVVQDEGEVLWPQAILGCIKGEFLACIFNSPQIRDVVLGACIDSIENGYAVDWDGKQIFWPQKGRLENIIFGFNELPNKIKSCLKL